MTLRSALFPSLLLATSLSAATDMTGVWSLDITWKDTSGHTHPVCTLSVTDQKVSGECKDEKGAVVPIVTGKATDKHVGWQTRGAEKGKVQPAKFEATIAGEGLTGTVESGGMRGTFVAKRE
jgi:hypothetical protein